MSHNEHDHHDEHDHDHDHPHDHGPFQPDIKEPSEDWEFLEIALRELMIEKDILTARVIQEKIVVWDG
ncbi:MAG: hypothetical protein AB7O71_20735, partial [Hyphomicrobiaceae bacterium]